MEPDDGVVRVDAMDAAVAEIGRVASGDVEDLYAASYARLVRLVTVLYGNAADAEEVVQEAFVRVLPEWERVSRYDDPEAWVRGVAIRLSTSRWRRARSAARAVARLGAEDRDTAGPDAIRVDAERTLAALPRAFREVLVLHHGLGLPVDEVGRALGVPAGTVKSRLSRARAAAAALWEETP
jgi:RNA polymerase sigma-70 factor (ECF subfamily)